MDSLNAIKRSSFSSVQYSFSEKMLKYFASDTCAPRRFRAFHIHKKNGGLREIKKPCRQLDVILTCVNTLLRSLYEPSDAAMGFAKGRSILKNAQAHVGHNYVFNIDLKDFFTSIPQARVWKRLQLPPFNLSPNIANVLAGLCCCYNQDTNTNVLPQGSPTSPLLTNAICDKLDRKLKGVAKRFGLNYTRYADDISFSSMHNVYQQNSKFMTELRRIITEQGFTINEAKTRLQKKGTRQEVTGITVNNVTNISRKFISDLRWIINVWEKEGYAKAYAMFYTKYKCNVGYKKKGEPIMENVIGGRLNYMKMIRGDKNSTYLKLFSRFTALQKSSTATKATTDKESYKYIQTYPITDFQSLFQTDIFLVISRNSKSTETCIKTKIIAKCIINGQTKIIAISAASQYDLLLNLECNASGQLTSSVLSQYFITLCSNKGKNFWLITQSKPKRIVHRTRKANEFPEFPEVTITTSKENHHSDHSTKEPSLFDDL